MLNLFLLYIPGGVLFMALVTRGLARLVEAEALSARNTISILAISVWVWLCIKVFEPLFG